MSEATTSLDVALNHASRLLGSDPEQAGQQVIEILRVVPQHSAALLVLAASHRLRGRADEALTIL